jgi:hypothetical protein
VLDQLKTVGKRPSTHGTIALPTVKARASLEPTTYKLASFDTRVNDDLFSHSGWYAEPFSSTGSAEFGASARYGHRYLFESYSEYEYHLNGLASLAR